MDCQFSCNNIMAIGCLCEVLSNFVYSAQLDTEKLDLLESFLALFTSPHWLDLIFNFVQWNEEFELSFSELASHF